MSAKEEVRPATTSASPEGWEWSALDASRPRRAVDHIGHSEASPVFIDRLGPADVSPDSKWALTRHIPIILVDTEDTYWAFERVLNKLHSFSRTKKEAKADLVAKLGGHRQLLTSLESPTMAPVLRLELEFLHAVLKPIESPGP